MSLAQELQTNGWLGGIELSGGRHDADLSQNLDTLKKADTPLLLHNYFPPPKTPFVMNLSEVNDEKFVRTKKQIEQSILLSAKLSARFFGIHAGFLFSPEVSELGRTITPRAGLDRQTALQVMCERVIALSAYAERYGVRLLLENHVLSHTNLESVGSNFLLMVDPDEILSVLRLCEGRVGLLLDVGHLKVSANTLQFNFLEAFVALAHIAEGFHLSTNDGKSDQHLSISMNEPWLSLLPRDKAIYTLEAHSPSSQELIASAHFLRDLIGR